MQDCKKLPYSVELYHSVHLYCSKNGKRTGIYGSPVVHSPYQFHCPVEYSECSSLRHFKGMPHAAYNQHFGVLFAPTFYNPSNCISFRTMSSNRLFAIVWIVLLIYVVWPVACFLEGIWILLQVRRCDCVVIFVFNRRVICYVSLVVNHVFGSPSLLYVYCN